jgi:ubiquinone/menaquinone biosynthesis C-methylase UbiE
MQMTQRITTLQADVDAGPWLAHCLYSVESHRKISGPLVDIGCGKGDLIPYIQAAQLAPYIGVDCSLMAIEAARKKFPDADFRVGYMEALPAVVPERCAAFVACCSLHFIPRSVIMHALRSIRSVLLKGATGCIVVPWKTVDFEVTHHHLDDLIPGETRIMTGWWPKFAIPKLRSSGFKVLSCGQVFDPLVLGIAVEAV